MVCVALPPSPTPLGAYAKKTATATITAKSNRFKAKQQLCTCITHFGALICRQCTTTTCWELPNFTFCGGCEHKRQQLSFSFLELQYSLLELNSRKTYQHLSNWTRWNKLSWSRRYGCCLNSLPCAVKNGVLQSAVRSVFWASQLTSHSNTRSKQLKNVLLHLDEKCSVYFRFARRYHRISIIKMQWLVSYQACAFRPLSLG